MKKFDVKKNGKTAVLKLNMKKLDATVSPELKAEFLVLCKPTVTTKLIIDMTDIQFCDSSGLSALLIADRTMREHGGSVHLAHVHKKVMDLMKISQLDRIFTISDKLSDRLGLDPSRCVVRSWKTQFSTISSHRLGLPLTTH